MIRIVLENLVLFLTPALLYFAYVYLMQDAQQTGAGSGGATASPPSVFEGAPYFTLFVLGATLVLIALVAFGSTSGGKPGQTYSAPTMKDGKIQPGHSE